MTSDPDQIRGQIEQTQQQLSSNVDALTDKVSPPRIVKRRMEGARTAMTNAKDKIMGTVGGAASTARDAAGSAASTASDTMSSAASSIGGTVSSATETVRAAPETARQRTEGNPLATGLIAFGAGWLISSLLPASSPERQLASQAKDTAMQVGRPMAQQAGEAAQQVAEQLREPAQQAAESVKNTASGAAGQVSEQAQSAAGDVAGRAQQAKEIS